MKSNKCILELIIKRYKDCKFEKKLGIPSQVDIVLESTIDMNIFSHCLILSPFQVERKTI